MATSKVTFVTGTAEMKRRDPGRDSHLLPEQRLTTEPNTPLQVTYIDGKCTCCPYGYHIDLDFLNFCRDLEKGSTLKNLKRIQRAKRKLRKSMEMMLGEQEGMAGDPNLAPPDVVHSTEAGRLMHMINFERSATHSILHHIDTHHISAAPYNGEAGRRYMSSDSDEPNTPYTPPHETGYSYGEPNHMTPSYSTSGRTDSYGSLSSVSTVSSETPMLHRAELQQTDHSVNTKVTTQIVENPVLEMGTAEMKHYSTSSSAQLADMLMAEPHVERQPSSLPKTSTTAPPKTPPSVPPRMSPKSSPTIIPGPSPDLSQGSLQAVREAMAVSLQRMRELEEQVKTIPILQVRISVLKEEKRLLNLQLKASQANTKPPSNSVGVGDDTIDVPEKMERLVHSPKIFGFPKSFSADSMTPFEGLQVGRSLPPATSPKPVKTVTVGVGDHSVTEPYNLQPDLPTGYTLRDNETSYEIYSKTTLEQVNGSKKIQSPSLNITFPQSPGFSSSISRDIWATTPQQMTSDSSQTHFTINQIQRSTPKAMTRTIGIGDGNVFEGAGLHVHEKEVRTVIIGQNNMVAKRNVGIECRVPTRDVGVSFMCDEAKPETRTVGVNVTYDTSDILTSLDFRGETQLRMALRDVLQRNVRSVATNCNFKSTTVDSSIMTEQTTGVSVGCGDEDHRVDVEIRPATVKKSQSVAAKPDAAHKCISTEAGWLLDASTNTYQAETYHKAIMTDKQKQLFASTNTEPTLNRTASNQTEYAIFVSLNQMKQAASNTDQTTTISTGIATDILPTFSTGTNTAENIVPTLSIGTNTTEKISDIFREPAKQQPVVKTKELKSILKKAKTIDSFPNLSGVQDITKCSETTETTEKFPASSLSENTLQKQTSLSSSQESVFLNKQEYKKKYTRPDGGTDQYSSLEISTRSAPLAQSFVDSREELVHKSSSQEDLDKRNSAFEKVSPTKNDNRFSETVVEHYIITKDGKKLISEEKTTTSSSGTSKSFRQFSDSNSRSPEVLITSSHSSESDTGTPVDDGCGDSSSGQCSSSWENGNTTTEKSYFNIINNPYMTVENLAEVSSILDSDTAGTVLTVRNISKTVSEDNLTGENREKKVSQLEKTGSGEIVYDMHRAGSVEDFMPNDIRKYMSIDPSASKDSGFGEDLVQRFSEELSSAADGGGTRSIRSSKTITTKRTTRTGDKVTVQETKSVKGPDGQITTTVTERNEEGKITKKGQDPNSEACEGETKTTSRFISQGSSDSDLLSSAADERVFADRGGFSANGAKSFSETTITTVGANDDELSGEVCSYGSLDRKTGKLKSIMKSRSSDVDSHQISNRKGITFAESVTGGTGSSTPEEDDNSSDSDSTTSFEEGSYDGQQGEVIYYCKDDEAIAQGLPGAQMFDQNIRETYELPSDVRDACSVLATYLTDSTSIQTKQLNESQNIVQQEWFQVSSHKLSQIHQVEDFLSSVNEISKRLLEYIINMTDANGNTAIHYCVSHCNFEIASLLLDSEVCDINKQNKAGYTPIMLAGLATVQNLQQRDIVRRLFSMGNVNARATSTQQTALMLAASHGRTEMVKLLVEQDADINLQDEDGSTALMCACEHGHLDVVTFLLAQPGIDANITDNENSTALSVAMETGHKDIGVILYKHVNFSKAPSPGSHKKRRSTSSPTPSNFAVR